MLRKPLISAALLAIALFAMVPVFAEPNPSMHQVYIAAEAGKLDEAQAMMDQVLREHPNSAKAHFVEAELLTRQGQLSRAQTELNTAERLAPGLPFAKPQAVQNLKARLSAQHGMRQQPQRVQNTAKADGGSSSGGWMIIIGLVLLAFFIFRAIGRRNAMALQANRAPGGYGPIGPMGQGGPMQGGGGGFGSGILGGLMSGAAMGAGLVAGEALAHRFMDGNHNHSDPSSDNVVNDSNDMGGSDFGVSDSSSWDSGGGGGGGDDWN